MGQISELKSEFPVQGQLNGTQVFEAAVVFVFVKYLKKILGVSFYQMTGTSYMYSVQFQALARCGFAGG